MLAKAPNPYRVLTPILVISVILLCLTVSISQVSAQNSKLEVIIEWPNEGETLYAGPYSLLHKIPVKGRIAAEGFQLSDLKVELEVISDGITAGNMVGVPDEDGSFEFFVTVNPHGPTQHFEIAFAECGYECHSSGLLDLPPGEITLVAKVTASNGDRAETSRQVQVDISDEAIVPVQLLVEDGVGRSLSGVSVSASTRVYLWRARFFSGTSDENGLASVNVEALNLAPTEYVFSVDRQILNGVLFEGTESQSVVLRPGAKTAPVITLPVSSRRGTIAGNLLADNVDNISGKTVWAIRAHSGEGVSSTVQVDGSFRFENIDLDEYILALDQDGLLTDGYISENQYANLLENPDCIVQIPIAGVHKEVIDGIVTDENGAVIPFAWISIEEEDIHSRNHPSDGRYSLPVQPGDPTALVAYAPGFFGQSQKLDLAADQGETVDIALERQEGTEVINWGAGEVVIPAESDVIRDDFVVTLRRGWLWGDIEGEPLRVSVAGKELVLSDAQFSIEYLPGQRAWLYVTDGTAQFSPLGSAEIVHIESGQMINLLNDGELIAVAQEPVIIQALQESGDPPLPITWEPSLGSRIREGLTRISVNLVQMITFVTYFIVSLGVLLVPLIAVYWWLKRRT